MDSQIQWRCVALQIVNPLPNCQPLKNMILQLWSPPQNMKRICAGIIIIIIIIIIIDLAISWSARVAKS